jgi:hypothetical protein
MTNIDLLKISLLEKVGEPKDGKADFISKASATLKFKELSEKVSDVEEEVLLQNASNIILNDLTKETKKYFDSIGIWITIGDKTYENSIDLSAFENMKEYGDKEIVPIYEFIKMTLEPNEIG